MSKCAGKKPPAIRLAASFTCSTNLLMRLMERPFFLCRFVGTRKVAIDG
jgi:hypothetical protein